MLYCIIQVTSQLLFIIIPSYQKNYCIFSCCFSNNETQVASFKYREALLKQTWKTLFSLSIYVMESLSEADCYVFGHFMLPEIKDFKVEGGLGGGVVYGSTAYCAWNDRSSTSGESFVACGSN